MGMINDRHTVSLVCAEKSACRSWVLHCRCWEKKGLGTVCDERRERECSRMGVESKEAPSMMGFAKKRGATVVGL